MAGRNWRKEVAIGLCQVVMVLTFNAMQHNSMSVRAHVATNSIGALPTAVSMDRSDRRASALECFTCA